MIQAVSAKYTNEHKVLMLIKRLLFKGTPYLFKLKMSSTFLLLWCSQSPQKCPVPVLHHKEEYLVSRQTLCLLSDYEAHFSPPCCNPHLRFSSIAIVGTVFSPDSLLVSNGRALGPPFTCQKPPQAVGGRDPIWNDKACPETADPQKSPGKVLPHSHQLLH